MVWYVVWAVLGAFGLLSAVWAGLGWLLPAGQGCVLVCAGRADEGILSRYRWLVSLGLLRCPLWQVMCPEESPPCCQSGEIVSPEALVSRLEQERYGSNGTGNGDPSGRHQRRGISEL